MVAVGGARGTALRLLGVLTLVERSLHRLRFCLWVNGTITWPVRARARAHHRQLTLRTGRETVSRCFFRLIFVQICFVVLQGFVSLSQLTVRRVHGGAN